MKVHCGYEEHKGAWQSDRTILIIMVVTRIYACVKIHETVNQKGKIDLICNNFLNLLYDNFLF